MTHKDTTPETIYELVVVDNGVETTETYDPIAPDEVIETDYGWRFNNTYLDYEVRKRPGRTIIIRERVESDD